MSDVHDTQHSGGRRRARLTRRARLLLIGGAVLVVGLALLLVLLPGDERPARAEKLTTEQRREIARKAATARWKK